MIDPGHHELFALSMQGVLNRKGQHELMNMSVLGNLVQDGEGDVESAEGLRPRRIIGGGFDI